MKFTTERPLTWQTCTECGNELPAYDPSVRCRSCGGLLEVNHRAPDLTREELIARFAMGLADGRLTSGVWRFAELVLPGVEYAVTHPEGNTPLLHRDALAEWCGVDDLLLKHEGYNPTGSFKDRGMTVGVTHALRIGATAVACASTGNTSASLAAYAAQAEIPGVVLVPSGQVAMGKLAQTLAYGARTLLVRGDFDDCLRLIEAASDRLGMYLLNSINPFRIEGQKTIVLEMLQQLDWAPPEWLVVPAGNLGNTAAFGKALREAFTLGLIERVPRIVAVQAAGAAPFARAFEEGFATRHPVKAETIATAIRIGDPASWSKAVQAIEETDGLVLAVTDDEIMAAKRAVDGCGIGCEPASAAAIAGVKELARRGLIAPDETVVAVLTGHILKDPGILIEAYRERPIEVDATLPAIERALALDN